MNSQTSAAGKSAAPARTPAKKADAPQNKADQAEGNKARTLTGDDVEAAGHSDPSTRAGAGAHEGSFTVLRELQGDRNYGSGDPRDGKVSDLAHLARSGAIAPADKATQSALADYAGIAAAIVKPKNKAPEADDAGD